MNVPDTIYGKLAPGTAGAGVGDPVGDPQTEKVAWCVCMLCAGPVLAWQSFKTSRSRWSGYPVCYDDILTNNVNNKNNSEQQSRW